MRIAVLEDEAPLADLLRAWLEAEGHHVAVFDRGTVLIDSLRKSSFDLLILDWIVPELDGEQVLAWVRGHLDWPIPVLFVTQRDEEEDIARMLLAGADDYLVKPVRQRELLARIAAVSRRVHGLAAADPVLEQPPYRINTAARTVTLHDRPVALTQKEFELAAFLFRNAGRILSRDHILEAVWGHRPGMNTRTVDTHISRLRNKLALAPENGWRLSGIYHHGYRLERVDESERGVS